MAPAAVERGGGIALGGAWTWLSAEQQAADLDRIVTTGAKWIRVSFRWSSMQPGPDRYNWSVHDRIVRMAWERGLSVLANVAYTPAWARPEGCDHPHCPPAVPEQYAAFTAKAVQRYAPYGVTAWEIWNEPNLHSFWRTGADPESYARLLSAAGAAAKEADPTITVVSGGLAPRGMDSAGNLTPVTFLERMYAAGPSSFDAVGIHPYSFPRPPLDPHPTNTFAQLPVLRDVLVAFGDGDKQIWATEYAYKSSPPGEQLTSGTVTEPLQAAYLLQAYDAVAERPWMGPLLWFTLRETEGTFGLLHPDGSAKPAVIAFRQALTGSGPAAATTRIGARRTRARIRTLARLRPTFGGERLAVELYRRRPSGWRLLHRVTGTVDAAGRLRTSFSRPHRGRCRVRAVFPGTATHRRSTASDRLRC